ncbi:hypothetical protein IBT49_21120 [Erwinia sp. S63]|uniref:hypothetical protein n=1 Tax=Erwinia sp. S63 TaxID=2769341 RepID=UPI00190D1834|nr:hypothetical protein [Erwinia sp. S63]MBK0098496.1 hypothetical protein [Erwinia sp. S63]
MMTETEAINLARDYAEQHRTGWSESDVRIQSIERKGKQCLVVHSATADLNGRHWMEFETTTPLKFYIDTDSGQCFGHEYGNRGLIPGR